MGTSDPARLAVALVAYGTDQLLDLADECEPPVLLMKSCNENSCCDPAGL